MLRRQKFGACWFSALVGVQKYNKTAIARVISPAMVRRQRLNKKR